MIACENSCPSSLPARVAVSREGPSRVTPLGPGAKKVGCFRSLWGWLRIVDRPMANFIEVHVASALLLWKSKHFANLAGHATAVFPLFTSLISASFSELCDPCRFPSIPGFRGKERLLVVYLNLIRLLVMAGFANWQLAGIWLTAHINIETGALSIRPNIPVWNSGYSMRRMEQYFPVPWTNPSQLNGHQVSSLARKYKIKRRTLLPLLTCFHVPRSTTLKLK